MRPSVTVKERVFEALEFSHAETRISRFVRAAIVTLILLNITALVLETVPELDRRFGGWFRGFEAVSLAIFTVEYLLRLWSANVDPRYAHPVRGRLRFAQRPLVVIDLLAILPSFLPFIGADLRFLRIARLFRLLRTAKLARYSASLQLIGRVLTAKKEQLVVVLCVSALLILTAASLMYFSENAAQPDEFSSIPAAMWWAVVTLSTVGYGDVYPITFLGRLCAAAVALLGIGMFALPAGILGSGFVSELERKESDEASCPHCGKSIGLP